MDKYYTEAEFGLLFKRLISSGYDLVATEAKEFVSNMKNMDERFMHPAWKGTLARKVYKMLRLPLIKIPLFISDKDKFIKTMAVWRLEIGR